MRRAGRRLAFSIWSEVGSILWANENSHASGFPKPAIALENTLSLLGTVVLFLLWF